MADPYLHGPEALGTEVLRQVALGSRFTLYTVMAVAGVMLIISILWIRKLKLREAW